MVIGAVTFLVMSAAASIGLAFSDPRAIQRVLAGIAGLPCLAFVSGLILVLRGKAPFTEGTSRLDFRDSAHFNSSVCFIFTQASAQAGHVTDLTSRCSELRKRSRAGCLPVVRSKFQMINPFNLRSALASGRRR